MSNSLLKSFVFLKCNLALWTVNWWTGNFDYYCSCHDSFICCSVLLAFFNYITKICHIITTVVNAPIPVHLSASMVRPRPRILWPRPRTRRLGLGFGFGLVMSGLVNIPDPLALWVDFDPGGARRASRCVLTKSRRNQINVYINIIA